MGTRSYSLGFVGLDFPDSTLENFFRFTADEGLDFVDLYNRVNFVEFDVESIRTLSERYGVKVNSISSRTMPNAANVSARDEVQLALETLEQAARLGVVLSEGMVGSSRADLSTDHAIENYLETISPLLKRAETLGITIVVENVFNRDGGRDVTATVEGTIRLMEIANGALGLCWDTANYIVAGDSPKNLGSTIDRVLPWARMIQLKDLARVDPTSSASGLEDTRLMADSSNGTWRSVPLGEGDDSLALVVDELGKRVWQGPVSVEMFTSKPATFEVYWARSRQWLQSKSVMD